MAGRFLVFMPTVDHVGISRKIESREERSRLRGIVREFREQHGFTGGVIIRTAAAGRPQGRHRRRPRRYFHKIWTEIRQRIGVVARAGRRLPGAEPRRQAAARPADRRLHRPSASTTSRSTGGCSSWSSGSCRRSLPRVKLYTKDYPIFEEYGVQAEIDKALRSKVWLKSGGSIVINQTEALVAIDVNTGRYVGKKTSGRLEDTIVKTNLEAVKEIVRQLRLRDLGGIIVLDFIDMEEKKNRQKVFQDGRAGTAQGSLAVEGAAGLGFRAGDHHAQARQAEPRARADRAVPVLLGHRRHQVELDDLLRDSDRGEEDRPRPRTATRAAAGQSGHRPRAEGGGERRAART